VKPGARYTYFDPIDQLPPEGRARWADPREHQVMVDEALRRADGA
jgi:lysine 2,3-aminomutase